MTADLDRLWARVDRRGLDECWEYHGPMTKGYGDFYVRGRRSRRAHRFAYEEMVGPIPDGMTLDHLCRNRACVNPAHLEPVTNRENVLRGVSTAAQRARWTHCPRGHEYTANDVEATGRRRCVACRKINQYARVARDPEKYREQRRRWRGTPQR